MLKDPKRKMRTKMVEKMEREEEEERAFCLHNFASIARLGIGMQQELAMWRGKSGSFALWVLVGCSADCLAGWLVCAVQTRLAQPYQNFSTH